MMHNTCVFSQTVNLFVIFGMFVSITTEDDLFDVYREVLDVAAVWSDIGLALRMRKPELDVICESHPLSPKDCLKAVLSGWLQGRNRIPTWGALCEAVAEPAGGNNRTLAEEIACNHGVTLKPCEDLIYIHHCHYNMCVCI